MKGSVNSKVETITRYQNTRRYDTIPDAHVWATFGSLEVLPPTLFRPTFTLYIFDCFVIGYLAVHTLFDSLHGRLP